MAYPTTVVDVVNKAIGERHMTMMELSRRAGITYENLRVTLNNGRNMRANELLRICRVLGLAVSDFDEVD